MTHVLSRLWLWLFYLLPANPILVRVVHGASRRSRHLLLRTGYLSALLLVVIVSLLSSMSGQGASLGELAKSASQTFRLASMAQLALMCFLAPIFTASAITQERDAQTFNILLSTPLSNAQIVFGSLMSRLYFVLMLLLSGLPIFLMTMVYGGVTASQVLESFALSGATAILTGAVAIFVTMAGVGTRRTIFSFYLLIVIYLLSIQMAGGWSGTWVLESAANLDGERMSWLTPLHPFLSLQVALNQIHAPPYARLGEYSSLVRYALAYPSATYVAWTSGVAFLLTTSAIVFVRRGAKTGESTFFSRLRARLSLVDRTTLTRPPRVVWRNPVAWAEAKTRSSGGGFLRSAIVAAGFIGPLIVFYRYVNGAISSAVTAEWLSSLIMIQFALAMIVATNTAATSITKEKESKTMEMLLTTPLTSKYILWGKLRGLVSFAVPLLVGPVLGLVLFGVHGLMRSGSPPVVGLETALEVGFLLVIYTSFACVIGLWRSLNSRTNVSSVMFSVGILVLLCGVTSLIGFEIVGSTGEDFGAFLAPFAPFTLIRYLVCPRDLFSTPRAFSSGIAGARMAAAIGSLIAMSVYIFIVWRLYAGLVRSFDMTLRKQSAM